MNPQEIFDTVARHLITQGKPARVESSAQCLYRYRDLKCAVGCLIPDELYSPEFENHTARQLHDDFPQLRNIVTANHLDLLMDLQAIHDGTTPQDPSEVFGWDLDREGEARELLKSIISDDEAPVFNIPKLMRALTFVAYKHNLNPEVVQ